MSNNINSDAWNKLLDLAKKVGGTDAVNNASVERMIKRADADGDGIISFSEFQKTYDNIEDEYLEAFEAIAGYDGDAESMSQEDIDAMMQTGQTEGSSGTGGTGGTSGTGSSGTGNTQPGGSATDEPPATSDAPAKATPISRSDLEGKDSATLQTDRSSLLNEISSNRAKKDQAASQARQDAETAKTTYETANESFETLMEECEAQKEERSEAAEKVDEAQSNVDTADAAVADQESAIAETEATIDTANSNLSGLTEPPQFIYEEVSDGNGGTKTVQKDNPDYAVYLEQKAELEAQIAEAEAQLAEQEAKLTDLETQLTEAQTVLQQAQQAYVEENKQDAEFGPKLTEAQAAIDTAKQDYDTKKSAENTIEQEWDAQIDVLQNNLAVYNDAIAEAQKEEEGQPVPDGYSIQDGVIVSNDEKNKHVLTPVENMDNFPEGAQTNENGEIVDDKGNVLGRVETAEDGSQQIYLKEPAPISDSEKNEIVQQLLYGDGKKDAEDFWSAKNGVDFSKINSYDMAEIEEMYNQQVEAHNSTVEPSQVEELPENATVDGAKILDANGVEIGYLENGQYFLDNKWQNFADKVYTVNNDGNAKNDNKGIDTVADKLELAQAREDADYTFEEYLKDKDVDILTTSGVILDSYMNDYIQSQLEAEDKIDGSSDYHERTLSPEQVTEVVDALINGAEKNGEKLTASEMMVMFDFESLSPDSMAQVIQSYNAHVEENGGQSFADAVKFSEVSPEQKEHIADTLIRNLDNPEFAEVSQQTLEQLVMNELENGNSPILDSILNSASTDVANLANVQKFIQDSGLQEKIQDLNSDLSKKMETVMNKSVVTENDLWLASQLADGGKEVWDNLNIPGMTQEEIANLQTAYDALNGEGSFMERLETVYPQNGADIIKSAVDSNEVSEDDTVLSNGSDVETFIEEKMSTKAGFREEVDALLEKANTGNDTEKAEAMKDLAIIANQYGEDNFLAMYKSVYDEVPSEYTTIRESVKISTDAKAEQAEVQADKDRIDAAKSEIEAIFDQDKALIDAGLEPDTDHTDEVVAIITNKLGEDGLTAEDKVNFLNSLSGEYKEYVKAYLDGDSSVMDEVFNSGDVTQITNFVDMYNTVNAGKEGQDFVSINSGNIENILKLYENATPETAKYLNSLFDTPTLIQQSYMFGKETTALDSLYQKVVAGTGDVQPLGKSGNAIAPEIQEKLIEQYDSVEEILAECGPDGKLSNETAIWLLNQIGSENVIDQFRDMSNRNQELYLDTLFGLYQ